MDKKYSTMCFCEDDYKEYYDYSRQKEVNETKMWDDIKDFMRIAVKNGYMMKVHYDGMTVMIDYNYQDEGMAGVSLEWLGEDEYIGSYKEEKNLDTGSFDDDEDFGGIKGEL